MKENVWREEILFFSVWKQKINSFLYIFSPRNVSVQTRFFRRGCVFWEKSHFLFERCVFWEKIMIFGIVITIACEFKINSVTPSKKFINQSYDLSNPNQNPNVNTNQNLKPKSRPSERATTTTRGASFY